MVNLRAWINMIPNQFRSVRAMTLNSSVWIMAAFISVAGCSPKHEITKKGEGKALPIKFAELTDSDSEVFPLANGNAYLVDNTDQQLFLLSESRAQRVENVEMMGFDATVYSLPSGAAYLVSSDGQRLRLFYLDGTKATLVQEGPVAVGAMRPKMNSAESYLWAQSQAAFTRLRRAKADVDSPELEDPRE